MPTYVNQNSIINVSDLTQLQSGTLTTAGTTCQRAQIVALGRTPVPSVGDLLSAAVFNSIIGGTVTLDTMACGTIVYIKERNASGSDDGYSAYYKVGNSGHYTSATIPLMRAEGLGGTQQFHTTSSPSANDTKYQGSALAVRLNDTFYNSLISSAKNLLVSISVACRSHTSSSSLTNISYKIWAPSEKELFGTSNIAEGQQFAYCPPPLSDHYWTRSVSADTAGQARAVNSSNTINSQSWTNAYYARPVICVSKSATLSTYGTGYKLN